ncbi:MAG: general secretion pathway protein G [Planctomycetota bacterium]|jgi:general secretion pathway protein G
MQPTPKHHQHAAGFTLIEIMVVVAILGLLATLVVMNVGPAMDDAREERIQTDLGTIAAATKLYHLQKGELPSMEALLTPDEQDRTFIDDPSLDPWKEPYHILPGDSKRTFFVVCAGRDKTFDTEDDVRKKARL